MEKDKRVWIEGALMEGQKNILVVCPECQSMRLNAFWNIKNMEIHFKCFDCNTVFVLNEVNITQPIKKEGN